MAPFWKSVMIQHSPQASDTPKQSLPSPAACETRCRTSFLPWSIGCGQWPSKIALSFRRFWTRLIVAAYDDIETQG